MYSISFNKHRIYFDSSFLFYMRAQCGFAVGAGRVRAGIMRGVGQEYLVWVAGRVTRTGEWESTAMATGRLRVRNFSPLRALGRLPKHCNNQL